MATINYPLANKNVVDAALAECDSPMYKSITVLRGGDKLPIVDSVSKTLVFPRNNYDWIFYVGGVAYPVAIPSSGATIDLSTATGTSAWGILFNLSDKSLLLTPWNTITNYKATHALFATFRIDGGKYCFNMPCPFMADGKLYGATESVDGSIVKINPLNANVKAIAHRGYSTTAPENTLPAYKLAKDMGFSYVECDVEWTSDGVPVLLHDSTIDRTSNGTGAISSMTLAEVKTFDFGSWKSAAYAGTTIPTLAEFIVLCKKLNLHPYIELKGGISTQQATTVVSIVRKLGMINNVTWISFSYTSLQEISALEANARLGYVGSISSEFITSAAALKSSTNQVFIDSDYGSVTQALAEQSLMSDVPVEVWTVDTSSLISGLVDFGISGITTNSLNIAEILES